MDLCLISACSTVSIGQKFQTRSLENRGGQEMKKIVFCFALSCLMSILGACVFTQSGVYLDPRIDNFENFDFDLESIELE